MRTPKTILVGLDLSRTDETIITYANFLVETLDVEQVYFVHNIKTYELSQHFIEQLEKINVNKIIKEELNEKVSTLFTASAKWEVLVTEDPYTETLINYMVNKYSIELVILGNKNYLKGSSTVSGKLLRMLKCDLLLVPKNPSYSLQNIWAGTDFSRDSRKAMGRALGIAQKTGGTMTAAHVYKVPIQFSAYLPIGSMTNRIIESVTKKSQKFIQSLDFPMKVEQKIISAEEAGIAEKIIQESQMAKADLLVLSDKGSNIFSTLLIGSVTASIYNQITTPALWIAKW